MCTVVERANLLYSSGITAGNPAGDDRTPDVGQTPVQMYNYLIV